MTTLINQLRSKIAANQFEFSKHALDQSILRGISVQELREAIANGEVIEDYPDDKYRPSCLVFGMTKSSRPLHNAVTLRENLSKLLHFTNPIPSNGLITK